MRPLQQETIRGFNEFLATQKKEPGEAVFTLATFASAGDYRLVYDAIPLSSVPDLNTSTYDPNGWTALLDAIGHTCNSVGSRLALTKEENRPSKVLVLIMTDGDENQSRNFNYDAVKNVISHQRDKYSWEFVFIGANQDSILAGASIGIDATHSYNFVATAAGSASMFESVTRGVTEYRSSDIGVAYNMTDPTAGIVGAGAGAGAGAQTLQGQAGVFNFPLNGFAPLIQPVAVPDSDKTPTNK